MNIGEKRCILCLFTPDSGIIGFEVLNLLTSLAETVGEAIGFRKFS